MIINCIFFFMAKSYECVNYPNKIIDSDLCHACSTAVYSLFISIFVMQQFPNLGSMKFNLMCRVALLQNVWHGFGEDYHP